MDEFEVGDIVEFGDKMEHGQILAILGDECVIEYFDANSRYQTKTVNKENIFSITE